MDKEALGITILALMYNDIKFCVRVAGFKAIYSTELPTTDPLSRTGSAVVKFLISPKSPCAGSPVAASPYASKLFHFKVA